MHHHISGIDITSSHLPVSVVFAVPDQDLCSYSDP